MQELMTPEEMKACATLLRQACETAPNEETRSFRRQIAQEFEQNRLPVDASQLMAGATLIYQSSLRAGRSGDEQERDIRFSLAIKLAIVYGERGVVAVVEDSVIGI